jgi:hypothetical protein
VIGTMRPRSWSDWLAVGWLAASALSVLVALAAQTYPVWRIAGWTSSSMILLGGPLALFLMAERFLRGVREFGGYGWPLALLCLTALPVAGLLIAGELLELP